MKKEYAVISSTYKSDFILKVQEKLNDGWELEGNLQSNRTGAGVEWYAQAMIRVTDNTLQDKQK